jgi:hypothetical protein
MATTPSSVASGLLLAARTAALLQLQKITFLTNNFSLAKLQESIQPSGFLRNLSAHSPIHLGHGYAIAVCFILGIISSQKDKT